MTLTQVIKAAGDLKPFARPCHGIASYYNGHVKDWGQRTRMAMLSLEDLEGDDWALLADDDQRGYYQVAGRFVRSPSAMSELRDAFLATAIGNDLDMLSPVERVSGETDESLRARALAIHREKFLPMVEFGKMERARHIAGQEVGRATRLNAAIKDSFSDGNDSYP